MLKPEKVFAAGLPIQNCELLCDIIDVFRLKCVSAFMHKARIPCEMVINVIGILDEFRVLDENWVFVNCTDPKTGILKTVLGPVPLPWRFSKAHCHFVPWIWTIQTCYCVFEERETASSLHAQWRWSGWWCVLSDMGSGNFVTCEMRAADELWFCEEEAFEPPCHDIRYQARVGRFHSNVDPAYDCIASRSAKSTEKHDRPFYQLLWINREVIVVQAFCYKARPLLADVRMSVLFIVQFLWYLWCVMRYDSSEFWADSWTVT